MSPAPPKRSKLAFAGTRRGRWPALALWAALAAVGFTLGPQLSGAVDDSRVNWLPADAESTRAMELAEAEFDDSDTAGLLVLYTAEEQVGDAEYAAVEADRAALDDLAAPGETTAGPVPSEDGRALMLAVPVDAAAIEDEDNAVIADADAIVEDGLPSSLEAGFTGEAAIAADMEEAFSQLDGPLTWMSVGVVALVLALSYRSPLLLLLPLSGIAIASQLASGAAYLLGEYAGATLNNQNTGVLTVLVFGASTNYTLLLVSRYREELRRRADRFEAMSEALSRTLPAVAASAGTVVLALAVLPLAAVSSTAALGPVLIVGVVSAVLASTTLLPAALTLFGRAVFWPVIPRHEPGEDLVPAQRRHRIWGGVARLVSARPRTVAAAVALGLGALAVGATGVSAGLDQSRILTTETESQRVADRMAEHFPAGAGSPAEVYAPASEAEAVTAVLDADDGVARVPEPQASPTSDWVRIDAVLVDEASTAAAQDTVAELRAALDDTAADALVGGATATRLDLDEANARDAALLIPLIFAVVLAVIGALLRAVTAAVVLTLCTVLSYAAAVGAAGLVLDALGHGTVDYSFFLLGFLFLVAMGVDYTIFLMTRAREEVPAWGHRVGVLRSLTLTGGVITSAGLVLAATFAVLALMPLTFLMQIGVVVALGVLVDAIIVRSLLVPALTLWIGERMWWPGPTARPPGRERAGERREPAGASA
ncbi:MMPL family transporter [Glycomyces xiaoerkulensis]|uniref:MMPL family transporter n=1 Tax=Glycomyces xiaoerkulensis TaxID=2038139 RepID=UPI0018E4BDE0|nr:MMPL family transporter [Glycomyces xiaoerkulensis]